MRESPLPIPPTLFCACRCRCRLPRARYAPAWCRSLASSTTAHTPTLCTSHSVTPRHAGSGACRLTCSQARREWVTNASATQDPTPYAFQACCLTPPTSSFPARGALPPNSSATRSPAACAASGPAPAGSKCS